MDGILIGALITVGVVSAALVIADWLLGRRS